ncbi:MAG: M20 family metallopeptidase [Thermoplasmata archaeon]|nr:M20 family metallopeptidase [Thermoplasmata archaeon]MCI4359045.1 M20 family metallopeptidase [Thermoplasmata archaeon]
MASVGPWTRQANRWFPRMRAWRRALYQEPELAYREVRTRRLILGALQSIGIRGHRIPGLNGVVATIGAGRPGPVVALRADMDALPIEEATGLAFRSLRRGKMHACGHDVHMACLLGAAAVLKERASSLGGPVRLVFQPAEEQGDRGGAAPMLEGGAFDSPEVDFVVGAHVEPSIPIGQIGWKVGPVMAAADHFVITVIGQGGHAAFPHRGPDAIVVAAEVVSGLQAIVSRARDPLEPVVVSVGSVHGGTSHNVLPDTVVLEGTVRTLQPTTRADMEARIRRRVRHITASLGASAEVEFRRGYPVTSNPPGAMKVVVGALQREFGSSRLLALERPMMGAEDFSRYLERVPGAFLFLGVGTGRTPSLHSARFAPPESILPVGAALLSSAAAGLQAA